MNDESKILIVDSLSAGYGPNIVLQDVSFGLAEGEILIIIGQNGSGKSTLLKSICGLIPKKEGNVSFKKAGQQNISPYKLIDFGISYFVQDGLIIPALTVREHFKLAGIFSGRNKKKEDLEEIFSYFPKLYEVKDKKAGNLSGGERQMLSFGILLMQKTKTWFLDEPTAGLAPSIVEFTIEFLKRKNEEEGITLLAVEHNMNVAFRLASHIAVTKNGTLTKKFNRQEFSEKTFLERIVYN